MTRPLIRPPPTPLTAAQRDLVTRHFDLVGIFTRKYSRRWKYLSDEIESAAGFGLIEASVKHQGPWTSDYFRSLAGQLILWRIADAVRRTRLTGYNLPHRVPSPKVVSFTPVLESSGHVMGPTGGEHAATGLDDRDAFDFWIHRCSDRQQAMLRLMFVEGHRKGKAGRLAGCRSKTSTSDLYNSAAKCVRKVRPARCGQ